MSQTKIVWQFAQICLFRFRALQATAHGFRGKLSSPTALTGILRCRLRTLTSGRDRLPITDCQLPMLSFPSFAVANDARMNPEEFKNRMKKFRSPRSEFSMTNFREALCRQSPSDQIARAGILCCGKLTGSVRKPARAENLLRRSVSPKRKPTKSSFGWQLICEDKLPANRPEGPATRKRENLTAIFASVAQV